jgi:hypothetical protein
MVETTISQPPPLSTGKEQGSTKKGQSKKEKKNQKGTCTTLSGNSLPGSGDDAVLRIISCQQAWMVIREM